VWECDNKGNDPQQETWEGGEVRIRAGNKSTGKYGRAEEWRDGTQCINHECGISLGGRRMKKHSRKKGERKLAQTWP